MLVMLEQALVLLLGRGPSCVKSMFRLNSQLLLFDVEAKDPSCGSRGMPSAAVVVRTLRLDLTLPHDKDDSSSFSYPIENVGCRGLFKVVCCSGADGSILRDRRLGSERGL
jgi:hypothetical protein